MTTQPRLAKDDNAGDIFDVVEKLLRHFRRIAPTQPAVHATAMKLLDFQKDLTKMHDYYYAMQLTPRHSVFGKEGMAQLIGGDERRSTIYKFLRNMVGDKEHLNGLRRTKNFGDALECCKPLHARAAEILALYKQYLPEIETARQFTTFVQRIVYGANGQRLT